MSCSYQTVLSTLVGMMMLAYPEFAHAHTLGGEPSAGPTPPIKAYLEEVEALDQSLPNGVGIRGVLDQFKLWQLTAPLIFCFNNGDQSLREVFVRTSQQWVAGTSLKFEFGNAPSYQTCANGDRADIRVSFNPGKGHWSYVGTDSASRKDTSLNIGYAAIPASEEGRNHLAEVILHEVGHAIGFEHEHQSPQSKCEEEFDWPRVYQYAKIQWGWMQSDGAVDRRKVERNMQALTSTERLRVTPYDRLSIMHYYFEPVLFKRGTDSPCFVGHNQTLSQVDKELAREAYPISVASQDDQLQKRANIASAALAPMNLSGPQLSRVGQELGQVLAAAPRKIILDFDLARASGKTLTRGPGDFQPCEQQVQQSTDPKTVVACEVAADASALLVAVEPK